MKMIYIMGTTSVFAISSLLDSPSALQFGALGILGYAVWFVLSKALPAERKAFLEAQAQERHDFLRELRHQRQTRNETTKALRELTVVLGSLERAFSSPGGNQ